MYCVLCAVYSRWSVSWSVHPKWFLNAVGEWEYILRRAEHRFDLFNDRQNVGFIQTKLFNNIKYTQYEYRREKNTV